MGRILHHRGETKPPCPSHVFQHRHWKSLFPWQPNWLSLSQEWRRRQRREGRGVCVCVWGGDFMWYFVSKVCLMGKVSNLSIQTARCHQSDWVFVNEHNTRGLDSTGCQLTVSEYSSIVIFCINTICSNLFLFFNQIYLYFSLFWFLNHCCTFTLLHLLAV